jgi:hypothetical protein
MALQLRSGDLVSRKHLRIALAVFTAGLLRVLVPATSTAQPWWPAGERFSGAGAYCAPDSKIVGAGTQLLRPPRDGVIVVRDFENLLRRLPAVVKPPRSGLLPFGPSSIKIRPARLAYGDRLVVGDEVFGYSLFNQSKNSVARLNWDVHASLMKLNDRGDPDETISVVRKRIGLLRTRRSVSMKLPTSSTPGIYRYNLSIKSKAARRLVSYSEYVRVLSERTDLRLGTKSANYSSGKVIYARVENLGTTLFRDPFEYSVERLSGSDWQRIGPNSLKYPPIPVPYLGIGKARCFSIRIPAKARTGTYRVVKQVAPVSPAGQAPITLTREFTIN